MAPTTTETIDTSPPRHTPVALDPPPTATSTDAVPAVEFFLSLQPVAAKNKAPQKVPLCDFCGSHSLIKKEYDREGDVNGASGIEAYYFGARMYDAAVGRWSSVDALEQDWDAYAMCGGNPVVFVDPDGNLYSLWNTVGFMIGAAIGGAVAGIAAYDASDGDWVSTIGASVVGSAFGGALGSAAFAGIGHLAQSSFYASSAQLVNMLVSGASVGQSVASNIGRYPDDLAGDAYDATKRYRQSRIALQAMTGNADQLDAFRHQYWQAGFIERYGDFWGEIFGRIAGVAHEFQSTLPNSRTMIIDQTEEDAYMDYSNNFLGRMAMRKHPHSERFQLIEQRINNGEWVNIEGKYVKTNRYFYKQGFQF